MTFQGASISPFQVCIFILLDIYAPKGGFNLYSAKLVVSIQKFPVSNVLLLLTFLIRSPLHIFWSMQSLSSGQYL